MATFERGDERREETENRKQMSGHKQKRKDETESQTNEQGFYVYCVGARAALESLFDAALPAAMEADARLELIADDALAAVCSAVSLADYGEEALQARLHDATWTALRALRHERADETRAAARRTSNEIERELARVSAGVARLRVLKDEASEHGDAVVKFAFLVARARFDDFRAAAERLAEAHAPAGYKLELTGPW